VAGYFRIGSARTALTVQVVEDAEHRLRVQTLAPASIIEALADAPENHGSAFFRVFDTLREVERQITTLAKAWLEVSTRPERLALCERIFSNLRHLSHSLERKGRQSRRRTTHAEVRSGQKAQCIRLSTML
jgi:hypothetical protein